MGSMGSNKKEIEALVLQRSNTLGTSMQKLHCHLLKPWQNAGLENGVSKAYRGSK